MFAGLPTEVEQEISIVEICKQFGWTYYDYLKTPSWFISTLSMRNNAEGDFLKRQEQDLKRKTKS
ncbi:hypothetical protein LCGC14_1220870 [marine sediment metagenome]|uniref:Uncharacterized protein n=1 Tax=marine sediment metagenome TaxID=412755 RepID=A0A0F9LBA8_9ZZZZ